MELVSKDDSLSTSGIPIQRPKRQHSIGTLSSSKKAKPYRITSTKFENEEYFTRALLEKDRCVELLTKEVAELKSNVKELTASESVEMGDLKSKFKQLRTSETLRLRVLQEENKLLKIHNAELLESEDVRIGDLNAQLCKLLAASHKKHGNSSPSKRNTHEHDNKLEEDPMEPSRLIRTRKIKNASIEGSTVSLQSSHDEEVISLKQGFSQVKNHFIELCTSGSIEVRDISIASNKKVGQVDNSDARTGELKAVIKRLQDILKLHGLEAYTRYRFAVKNMNDYSSDALRPKLGKEGVKKSSEEFRARIIGNSESNISATKSLNDKDKENQALRIKVLELKSTIEELTSSESLLIGELRNTIKRLNSEGNMHAEKLEKEIYRLNKEVKEGDVRIEELEVENKKTCISCNDTLSFDISDSPLSNKNSSARFILKPPIPVIKTLGEAKAGASDAIRNNQIGMILSYPIEQELKNGMEPGTKELSSSLHESVSRLALTPKSNLILSDTYPGRRPLGNIASSHNKISSINIELQKKMSLLSKEVNTWRLKATLLVEKKTYARTLEKENTRLKDRNEKLHADLEKVRGVSTPRMAMNSKGRMQSSDRYIV